MPAWLPAVAILLAAVGWSSGTAQAGSTLSLHLTGGRDAVVAYDCAFTDGATARGQVTPPWSQSWPADGVRCTFEQVVGRGRITIGLHGSGSRSQVSISGGGSVTLAIGRQRWDGP